MKYYVLFNPYSGQGGTKEKAEKIAALYENAEIIDVTEIESYRDFVSSLSENDYRTLRRRRYS